MAQADRTRAAAFPWGAPTTEEVTALVTDIRRFSVHHGPGVRSLVRLKGCPLRCVWCHQPEAQQLRPELAIEAESCRACPALCTVSPRPEACEAHPLGPGACIRCAREGLDSFLRLVGRHYSIDEVMGLLERDARLYECSGGGITLGGGEPLYQSVFATGLLRAARRRGWHTCLETSGQASTSVFEEALDYTDLVLFDLKETDLELHEVWTGVALEPIIRNLVRAAVSGAELRVRLPVVPLANDRDDHWRQVGDLLADLPGRPPVQLMPYRPGKVAPTGAPPGVALEPTPARLGEIANILQHHGLEVSVA